jgi:1-deoxypentalenic acid 11beta-hydroxylase
MPSNQQFGPFRVANEYLDDCKRLNSLFEEEGYLFFRSVLNSEEILKVKQDLIHVLQRQGVVKAGASEALWTGVGLEKVDELELYALPSYSELLESRQMVQIVEKILGEPVFMFKSHTIRYALPNDSAHATPAHQDRFFIRINQRFRTLWIPLMDIDEQLGGLALGGGSHKRGLLDHVEQESVYSYVFRDRKQLGVALESLPQPWLTTDYHPGDLLIFHNLMVHWALPNQGERVRLSLDNRFQPITARRTWQAEKSIMDVRNIRETAKRIATEEGASEPLFEAVVIELMHRGLDPQRAQIKALISELATKIP